MYSTNLKKLAVAIALASPLTALAAKPAMVTNANDDGDGSLRAAIGSGASKIIIKPKVGDIAIQAPLEYAGTAPLTIKGAGQTISGDGDLVALLAVTQGADLTISNLNFAGPGKDSSDYSIYQPGGGKGIFVKVPVGREGAVSVKLTNVGVYDVANHGVHVSDCDEGDTCGAGQGGGGDGSDASIYMRLVGVTVDGVGFGKQDADGIRVDDRGVGDIIFSANNSRFSNVGGDGVELDEGDEGDVVINVRNVEFDSNGAYCAPEYEREDYIDENSPGDWIDYACDDEGEPDVDDAFDIDEAGAGGIFGSVTNAQVLNSYDEGLDFDASGDDGDNEVDLDLVNIFAADNQGDAIKVSEDDENPSPGDVKIRMTNIHTEGEVQIEEVDAGNLLVEISDSVIGANADDLKLSEIGDGNLEAWVTDTEIGKDVEIIEEGAGDLDVAITDSFVADDLEIKENDGGTATTDLSGTTIGDDVDVDGI